MWLSEDVIEWYEKTAPTTEQARRRAAKAASMTYRNNNWRKSA